MITIVCVYNDRQFLEEYLMSSLKKQAGRYQLILVDNTQGRFSSAAEALNYGARQADTKYIMFVHSDIELCSNTWLIDAENILESMGSFGVAGVAGMSEIGRDNRERGRNIITHLENKREWEWGNRITRPEIVQTIDGCLIITPKTVYDQINFDEKVCDDWHLYDVDYCLSCKELGYEVYAIPLSVYHRSKGGYFKQKKGDVIKSLGQLPVEYYKTLSKVMKKHRHNYKMVYTTCGDYSTSSPVIWQRIYNLLIAGIGLVINPKRWKR